MLTERTHTQNQQETTEILLDIIRKDGLEKLTFTGQDRK